MYPVLIAAGHRACVERAVHPAPAARSSWPRSSSGCVPGVPIVVGVLPPPVLARYVAWLGLQTSGERGKSSPIPQLLADRTGWEPFVEQVAAVYRALPAGDRQHAFVLRVRATAWPGRWTCSGARMDSRGPSPARTAYWHWSLEEGVDTDVLIAVGADPEDLRALFRDVRQVGVTQCTYCMSWRNGMRIHVARRIARAAPYGLAEDAALRVTS